MIHFILKYIPGTNHNPIKEELTRCGIPHRVFAQRVNHSYKSRVGLITHVYPTLVLVAVRMAFRSLVLSSPKPRSVIITSDVEAIIFGTLSKIFSRKTQIVFETFITTPRDTRLSRALHHAYYSFVLRFVDLAVCHSLIEVRQCRQSFPKAPGRFAYLPYGTFVPNRDHLRAKFSEEASASTVILSAGRSGRDYQTLADAIVGLPCKLRIICDWDRPTQGIDTHQVEVLRDCFGQDYLDELARAKFVVIPLSVDDISAGQMVMLKSFALGKAVISTRTLTTAGYAEDGVDALLVKMGDVADMRAKIIQLFENTELCNKIGMNAMRRFDAMFSTEAYVRSLVSITAAGASGTR